MSNKKIMRENSCATSRVHVAWCLDVADRHRGQVVMMKMFVELRQTNSVLFSQPKRKHVCFSMDLNECVCNSI